MYDEKAGEKFPTSNPELETRGEYADIWEQANMMEDAPAFQGEDPYAHATETIEAIDQTLETEDNAIESKEKTRGGARSLSSFGLDTASRIYGLDTVLKTIEETDETDRDALNPMASIYSRLVPDPDERKNLFQEINKDLKETDIEEEKDTDQNDAIRQMKLLLQALENDDRFAGVRERAAKEGKDVVSYITSGTINPTLTDFFNGVDSASGTSVEEILNTIEAEEKEKEQAEILEEIQNA